MNNIIALRYSIVIIAVTLAACGKPGGTESNPPASLVSSSTVAGEKYIVDKKESIVNWKGSMVFASKGQHNGPVNISNGELLVDKGQLIGGLFQIDMNTITDPVHGSDNDLINHLKSPDFFDVKKFPASTFVITEVVPGTGTSIEVKGNLTIKGIAQEVSFPATFETIKGIANATGKLTIDRTKWDIKYQSGKFFANLADEAIADEIEFDIKIVARK
jgi:polyisoprenoid-binding protein YceI